jgi:uncharacterized protein
MKSIFHAGEREVQERAGVAQMAARLGNAIHTTLPPVAQEFLRQQPMAIAAAVDSEGAVWASLLVGKPGFLQAVDAQTVLLNAEPLPGDPLRHILDTQKDTLPEMGLLVIELATRKRMRINGQAERRPERGFFLHVQQAYANCPKYIQARSVVIKTESESRASTLSRRGEALTAEQQEWIARSDTFFIASSHPEGGTDASHRGGLPGFVHVLNDRTLTFPDYAGNNMFNTLGNLTANPRAGLLFVNFETGELLQLTGETQILWDGEQIQHFPGAQRVIEFSLHSVIQTENALPLRWQLVEYSPFNPR